MYEQFLNDMNQYDKLRILCKICDYKLRTEKRCFICNINKTSLWRHGPLGLNTLCNACGLRYSRNKQLYNKKKINTINKIYKFK